MNIVNAAMKVILLTGSTDGIGLEAARKLRGQGHKVLLHGRNPSKLQKVARELGIIEGDTYRADLSDLSQVYSMAQDIRQTHDRIDVLLNNAGVFKTSANTITKDGLDVRFAVNTVAPYILTKELLPIIPKKHGRVVNLSSAAQAPVQLERAFSPINKKGSLSGFSDNEAYAQSKLAITMWSNALAQDYPDHIIFSVNPASLIGTNMVKEAYGVSGKPLSVGADILAEAAVGKRFASANGKYFDNDRGDFGRPHPDASHEIKNRRLVEAIESFLASRSVK